VIHRGNVPGYAEGQKPVVHLVSSIETLVASGRPWAFTDRHADLGYARYFDDLANLAEVNWDAMPVQWWTEVKEERQAEFLVHDWCPWDCVEQIGVYNAVVAERARQAIEKAEHQPSILVRPDWYY
jgi:hypothetical protein